MVRDGIERVALGVVAELEADLANAGRAARLVATLPPLIQTVTVSWLEAVTMV